MIDIKSAHASFAINSFEDIVKIVDEYSETNYLIGKVYNCKSLNIRSTVSESMSSDEPSEPEIAAVINKGHRVIVVPEIVTDDYYTITTYIDGAGVVSGYCLKKYIYVDITDFIFKKLSFMSGIKNELTYDINSAKTTANTAKTTSESAQSTAESAQSTAESAQSTAESAQSTAESAQSTANRAISRFDDCIMTSNTATGYGHSKTELGNFLVNAGFDGGEHHGVGVRITPRKLILPSSTEGSDMYFEIKVDDSGTITATEAPYRDTIGGGKSYILSGGIEVTE